MILFEFYWPWDAHLTGKQDIVLPPSQDIFSAVIWFFFLRPLNDSFFCGRYMILFYAAVTGNFFMCRRYKIIILPPLQDIVFAAVTKNFFSRRCEVFFLRPLQY